MDQYLAISYEDRILHGVRTITGVNDGVQYRPSANPPAWTPDRNIPPGAINWFDGDSDITLWPKDPTDDHPQFVSGLYARYITYFDAETIVLAFNNPDCARLDEIERRVKAMQANIQEHRYFGVLMGTNTVNLADPSWKFPCRLPDMHKTFVLDYFCPTMQWPQRLPPGSKAPLMWMVRLQKLDVEKKSWWARHEDIPPPISQRVVPPRSKGWCSICSKWSPKILDTKHFVCLDHHCPNWWSSIDKAVAQRQFQQNGTFPNAVPVPKNMRYDLSLLKHRIDQTFWPVGVENLFAAGPLIVEPFAKTYAQTCQLSAKTPSTLQAQQKLSQALLRGFVCQHCSRINPRILYTGWTCLNPSCSQFRHNYRCPKPKFELSQIMKMVPQGWADDTNWATHQGCKDVNFLAGGRFKVTTLALPNHDPFVAIVRPQHGVNAMEANGSDHFFNVIREHLRSGNVPARRWEIQKETTGLSPAFEATVEGTTWDDARLPDEFKRMRDAANLLFHNTLPGAAYFDQLSLTAMLPGTTSEWRRTESSPVLLWALGGHGYLHVGREGNDSPVLGRKREMTGVMGIEVEHGSMILLFGSGIENLYHWRLIGEGVDFLTATIGRKEARGEIAEIGMDDVES